MPSLVPSACTLSLSGRETKPSDGERLQGHLLRDVTRAVIRLKVSSPCTRACPGCSEAAGVVGGRGQ